MAGNPKRAIPGGKPKKKLVIPGKTTAKKSAVKKKSSAMKKPGVVPGKTKSKEVVEEPEAVPVILTDSNIISNKEEALYSKTMIEDVHVEEVEEASGYHPQTLHSKPERQTIINATASEDVDVEFLSDQVYAYHELSSVVDKGAWTPDQIIDLMDVFIRAINLDAVTIGMVDQSSKDKFCGLVSRGNDTYMGAEAVAYLQQSIKDGVIDWKHIVELVEAKESPFQSWVREELFDCLAFVPIHDGHKILGFIFAGTRHEYQPSDLATLLLELIGGRLGLSVTTNSVYS